MQFPLSGLLLLGIDIICYAWHIHIIDILNERWENISFFCLLSYPFLFSHWGCPLQSKQDWGKELMGAQRHSLMYLAKISTWGKNFFCHCSPLAMQQNLGWVVLCDCNCKVHACIYKEVLNTTNMNLGEVWSFIQVWQDQQLKKQLEVHYWRRKFIM